MNKIKLWLLSLVMAMATFVYAGNAFEFVNSADGYSYIQINENIESFTFNSDWHSLGNAGRVGYVVYTADMSESDRAAYMEANANNPQFGKSINGGTVDLGSLKAGDKVGFYETRPNGRTYIHTSFEDWKDEKWLAFDKNGGHGKDEWMTIIDIEANTSSGSSGGIPGGSSSGTPSGAPLPGTLAMLLVGGIGAYCVGKKK